MASHSCIQTYSDQAADLARRYESLQPEMIHKSWVHFLNRERHYVLDIGAGSGRDAAWMASLGKNVLAVEPSKGLLREAIRLHPGQNIQWVEDRLPDLKQILSRGKTFDLVLLSAVWMHLQPGDRELALKNLKRLTAERGVLVFTIRNGPSPSGREMFPLRPEELAKSAGQQGFRLRINESGRDLLGRSNVWWDTLVFEMV